MQQKWRLNQLYRVFCVHCICINSSKNYKWNREKMKSYLFDARHILNLQFVSCCRRTDKLEDSLTIWEKLNRTAMWACRFYGEEVNVTLWLLYVFPHWYWIVLSTEHCRCFSYWTWLNELLIIRRRDLSSVCRIRKTCQMCWWGSRNRLKPLDYWHTICS